MRRPPGGTVFEDRVEDGEQLAHARHQRHHLGLTTGAQSLVELLDSRVIARGYRCSHAQNRPHPLPPAPRRAPPPQRARVAVERSDAHQGRQLLGRELPAAQFGQLGQEGPREHGAYPRHATQQRFVLAPGLALLDRLVEVVVGALKLFFEPLYVRLDALLDGPAGRGAQAVVLGGYHLDDLASSGQDSAELLGFLVGDRPRLGAHGLAEAGEDLDVHPIGLGEPAGGPSEFVRLAEVDHRDRYLGGGQSGGDGTLQTTSGLEDHQRRGRRASLEPAYERVDAGLVVGDLEETTGGARGDIQSSFRDIYPHVNVCGTHHFGSPSSSWPILADAGSSALRSKARATVRAPPEDGRDDPGFPTVFARTKETSVCRARRGRILRPKPRYKETVACQPANPRRRRMGGSISRCACGAAWSIGPTTHRSG